jgi:hypothetical protein
MSPVTLLRIWSRISGGSGSTGARDLVVRYRRRRGRLGNDDLLAVHLDVDHRLVGIAAGADRDGALAARFLEGLAGLGLGFLGGLQRLVERLVDDLGFGAAVGDGVLRLAARFLDGVAGRAGGLARALERLALGAHHLAAGLAQLGARLVQALQGFVELLAALRVGGLAAHAEQHVAGDLDRVVGEGVVDLALDRAALLGGGAVIAVIDDVIGRDEGGQRHEARDAGHQQRPPGRLVQHVRKGLHGVFPWARRPLFQ